MTFVGDRRVTFSIVCQIHGGREPGNLAGHLVHRICNSNISLTTCEARAGIRPKAVRFEDKVEDPVKPQ